jgi:hypothetical protein
MLYAKLDVNNAFLEMLPVGNYEFSSTVYQPANTLNQDQVTEFRVVPVAEILMPTFNRLTQTCYRAGAEYINGSWQEKWITEDLPPENVAANQATFESSRVANLWQSAHDVEFNNISGSAVGLITMGVLQGKPKCLEVQNWIKTLWTEYYARKFSTSTDYDFSAFANCPHSVPELMAELGV